MGADGNFPVRRALLNFRLKGLPRRQRICIGKRQREAGRVRIAQCTASIGAGIVPQY